MESVPIDFREKNISGYSFYAVYSLSIDKDTISPYFGFSYLSSETEIDFFFIWACQIWMMRIASKLAKKMYGAEWVPFAVWHSKSWDFRKRICGKGLGKRKKSLKLQRLGTFTENWTAGKKNLVVFVPRLILLQLDDVQTASIFHVWEW